MKKYLFLNWACLLALPFFSFAQNWCGTDALLENQFQKDQGLEEAFYRKISEAANGGVLMSSARSQYTIPVVVHVIHDGGPSNISYEQIQDAITVMNQDFNRNNPDAVDTRSTADAPFQSVAANVDIEFKLAKKDPQGNCTNGVVRVLAPHLTNQADDACKHASNGGSSAWDNEEYMNIWVVSSIESDGAGTTLGYAYLPYSPNGSNYGILIRHDAMGTIGTSNSDGRTLTHEMGHCLGLLHTFQGNGGSGCHTSDCNQSGDYVCDTPPAATQTFGCVPTQNSCTQVPTNDAFGTDVNDQYENYMSYDACQNMFSEGQKTLIHNVLTNNQYNAYYLWQSGNLSNTGVNDPDVLCQAEFKANETIICEGGSIDFTDMSYSGQNDWTWTFAGGTPGTSTDQNPTVVYNTPGTYSVTLSVSDGTDNESVTKTDYITVLPSNGMATPFTDGFESETTIPVTNWTTYSQAASVQWEVASFGANSSKSMKVDNFSQGSGAEHWLTSNPIDLSGPGPILLTFDYAYKERSSSNNEYLRVYVSKDCGENWVIVKNIQGSVFGTGISPAPFEPEEEDWINVQVSNIASIYQVSNFRVRFEFSTDNGNHLYIDNINVLRSSVGLDDAEKAFFSIYPNPAKPETVHTQFTLNNPAPVRLNVHDMSGRKIQSVDYGSMSQGSYTKRIDVQNLAAGVYVVELQVGQERIKKKLIIE